MARWIKIKNRWNEVWILPMYSANYGKAHISWLIELSYYRELKGKDGKGWQVSISGKNKKKKRVRFETRKKAMSFIRNFKKNR